jgi:cytidylate kinase
MSNLIVTIDGPAASGKSTVARLLAKKLGASFLDTGAMYRAVTLAAMQAGVDLKEEELLGIINKTKFQFSIKQGRLAVCIDGVDVTEQIRQPQVTTNARYIASAPKVRESLVQMQREFAAKQEKIVTEGRDQGTVAFSDADIKFYLTAEPGTRAKRRQAELRIKGVNETLEQVQKSIEERDKTDQSREAGPLKPAEDAVIVDTTYLNIEEVVAKLLGYVNEKCLKRK